MNLLASLLVGLLPGLGRKASENVSNASKWVPKASLVHGVYIIARLIIATVICYQLYVTDKQFCASNGNGNNETKACFDEAADKLLSRMEDLQ